MTTIKVSLKTWKEKWKQKKASKTFHSRNNTHFKPGSYMYFYSYVISSIDKALIVERITQETFQQKFYFTNQSL